MRRLSVVTSSILVVLIAAVQISGLSSPSQVRAASTGYLAICKVAGPGVAVGSYFTYTVGTKTITLAAGPAPTGYCSNPIPYPTNSQVTVHENIPSGFAAASITVNPSSQLVGTPNLATGTVTVVMNTSTTTVTYTNQATTPPQTCTYTFGFYKNHPSALPAAMTVGGFTYNRMQLVEILNASPSGNGSFILLHQLIAAQANVTNGVTAPAGVQGAINQANTLLATVIAPNGSIGYLSPSQVSALADTLDAFNQGTYPGGPSHCS
jgi:hypothetical protein